MDTISTIGVTGGIILVLGAAYPMETFKHPIHSIKNWLFAVGGLFMLTYSILNYLDGGTIFFIFLQGLVNISSVFMLSKTPERFSTPVILLTALGLIIWSLRLFEGTSTLFFILGLTVMSLGYAFESGSLRRNVALTLGSILIALFSYLESSWIFFWLNAFFAVFSAYYSWKTLKCKYA